jgi:hypothetical protein
MQEISPEEFVMRTIKIVAREKGKPVVHVVYDGLNEAIREYYDGTVDPITLIKDMEQKGLIKSAIRRGGPIIMPADYKIPPPKNVRYLIEKIKQFESK